MSFPERIYTLDEYQKAKAAIEKGHKHRLKIIGDAQFKDLVTKILDLIQMAKYGELLRTYIRQIRQIDGISQLRETEASIWMNTEAVKDSLKGARFVIQKMFQMKAYMEGRAWYLLGESLAVKESLEFLRTLKERLKNPKLITRCEKLIDAWTVDTVT